MSWFNREKLAAFFADFFEPVEIIYVVCKELSHNEPFKTHVTISEEYLVAIDHNPFNRLSDRNVPLYCEDPDEAFIFVMRAAAEVAAVQVGGRVMLIGDARRQYRHLRENSHED